MKKHPISFRLPPSLWEKFKAQTDALFLSRAPFLDHMLSRELVHLGHELGERRLSLRAKRHIAGELKRTGPVSVNIEVRPETAQALRLAVKKHNLVRDAFIARMILFLRSSDALLDFLEIPRYANDRGLKVLLEEMPASPLRAMEAVRDDPMFYVRSHLQETHGTGTYGVELPQALDWAACYLDDERVPGTSRHRRHQKLWENLLELDSSTPPAGAKPSTRNGSK
jgi:hypothetical protein